MNEATKQLFEFVDTQWKAAKRGNSPNQVDVFTISDRIKELVDAGADINARNEEGFNLLQIVLDVQSPDQSLTSTINGPDGHGFIDDSAFYVDAILRNGFKCSKEELTSMLSAYSSEDYHLEPGDPKLICNLLELGADWNCQFPVASEHEPLLEVITKNIIVWDCNHKSDYTIQEPQDDWRYKMLCAYYNAGEDLYARARNGRYVWSDGPLSALAFFMEHGFDIPANNIETAIGDLIYDHLGEKKYILGMDCYYFMNCGIGCVDDPQKVFFPETFHILMKQIEKYPCIIDSLIKTLPGYEYEEKPEEIDPDFYRPAELFLREVKKQYGSLSKVTDRIAALCDKPGNSADFGDLGEFFTFALRDYPEITEYFPWEKLNADAWGMLLGKHPEFADKFPSVKFDDAQLLELLKNDETPEPFPWDYSRGVILYHFLQKKPDLAILHWDKFRKLSYWEWELLLPNFANIADRIPWKKFTVDDWCDLLEDHPQFADKCDKWDEFDSYDWFNLLSEQPQFADKCDKWEDISESDWKELLEKQPELAKYRK